MNLNLSAPINAEPSTNNNSNTKNKTNDNNKIITLTITRGESYEFDCSQAVFSSETYSIDNFKPYINHKDKVIHNPKSYVIIDKPELLRSLSDPQQVYFNTHIHLIGNKQITAPLLYFMVPQQYSSIVPKETYEFNKKFVINNTTYDGFLVKNYNCTECYDCYGCCACIGCYSCELCNSCGDCKNCYACDYSSQCENCSNVLYSNNCKYSSELRHCGSCNYSEKCKYCEFCNRKSGHKLKNC